MKGKDWANLRFIEKEWFKVIGMTKKDVFYSWYVQCTCYPPTLILGQWYSSERAFIDDVAALGREGVGTLVYVLCLIQCI